MSAIFVRPIRAAISQPTKLRDPTKILARRLEYFERLELRKSIYWEDIRRINPRRMPSLNVAGASSSEEGVQAFEQDALMGESSSFGAGGIQATLNSLTKWLVTAVFCSIILLRHDAESLWAAIGSVTNVTLSTALKRILNQERPTSTLKSDPGMPSSHAQSIFYTITFLNLSMVEWYGLNGVTTTLCVFFFTLGSFMSWLRVSQQFHTISQVVVGAVLGSIFCILWFWSWKSYVLNLFASYVWVRIVVVVGSVAFSGGFIYHVIQSWILKDR
ncbi:lipid phosphate phosphatase epsilon 2, chloroplastic isoform X1 [Primulina tabacum]|uniref:lipid phosphate phosphatase epsilon 2, chloroplastic isoform X1 n=1 Tax=Primulina tabacum TaxID=48773 RepID=UPI003F59EB0B